MASKPKKLIAPEQLTDLLKTAAHLEHCLLAAYTYAACTIKSTPEEFAVINGQENPLRAVSFEKARAWKATILQVCHEEMNHLHLVQCLLRCIGQDPEFQFPSRNGEGKWQFDQWIQNEGKPPVQVPVSPFTYDNIQNFVRYESSDAVGADPFTPELTLLYEELRKFDFSLSLEQAFLGVDNPETRSKLINALRQIYEPPRTVLTPGRGNELPYTPGDTFKSISDFYQKQILPLFDQAFADQQVIVSNQRLNNEIGRLSPPYTPANEGFMPQGIVPAKRSYKPVSYPGFNIDYDKETVHGIINEIANEGEGFPDFAVKATKMLSNITLSGAPPAVLSYRDYQKIQQQQALNSANDGIPVGPQIEPTVPQQNAISDALELRNSHFYRFVLVLEQLKKEAGNNVFYQPYRSVLDAVGTDKDLQNIAAELPAQFNNIYLVMLAWLSRMYEIRDWDADEKKRLAIQMLVTWPLMSMGIRPFLELAAFFLPDGIDGSYKLFNINPDSLIGEDARKLQIIFTKGQPDWEPAKTDMDTFALNILTNAATWASKQLAVVKGKNIPSVEKGIVEARLFILIRLKEFQAQFDFRVAGGYSNTTPSDLYYTQTVPNQNFDAFNEAPSSKMFENTFLLRLRFSGYAHVLLATDPDPPIDEVGVSGTLMYHAADSYDKNGKPQAGRYFDRSIVTKQGDDKGIPRQPASQLPISGLTLQEASIVVTDTYADSGPKTFTADSQPQFQAGAEFAPTGTMDSGGAVQSSGVQAKLQPEGFRKVWDVSPDKLPLNFNLLAKPQQGEPLVYPFLNGDNHVVWQDGEPIDPFILSIDVNGTDAIQREIFNSAGGVSTTMFDFTPMQRINSSRGPVGFGFDVPQWALNRNVYPPLQALAETGDPFSYINERVGILTNELGSLLGIPAVHSSLALPKVERLAKKLGSLRRNPEQTVFTWQNKGQYVVAKQPTSRLATQQHTQQESLGAKIVEKVEQTAHSILHSAESALHSVESSLHTTSAAATVGAKLNQQKVDEVIGYAQRLSDLNIPRGTTVKWLPVTLTYGHSLSGNQAWNAAGVNAINAAIDPHTESLTLGVSIPNKGEVPERDFPNGKWLVDYTLGMMDTDALRSHIHGEVYIPLKSSNVFAYTWEITFNASELAAVQQYALDFAKPFWGTYTQSGADKRTGSWITSPIDVPIVETLSHDASSTDGYKYTAVLAGSSFTAKICTVDDDNPEVKKLVWSVKDVKFVAPLTASILMAFITYFEENAKQAFTAKFGTHGPVPSLTDVWFGYIQVEFDNNAFKSQGNNYNLVGDHGTTHVAANATTAQLPKFHLLYIEINGKHYGVTKPIAAGHGPQPNITYHISKFQGDYITLNSPGVSDIRYNRIN